MGRYVLLEFDDNIAGDKFVEMLQAAQESGERELDVTAGIIAAAHSQVTAVYTKPAGLCACKSDLDNSLRGKKFGWWVCPTCKRPKNRQGQTLRNILNPKLENTTRVGSPSLSVRWEFKDGKVVTSIES
jgi:hypothetical protein